MKPTIGWMRVWLALMVVDLHSGFSDLLTRMWLVRHPASLAARLNFAGDGNIAVIGFFIISGYLVAHVVERKYDPGRLDHMVRFVVSRYMRIFPLFIACFVLFIVAALALIHGGVSQPPWQIASNALLLPMGIQDLFARAASPLYRHMTPDFWDATWTLPLDFLFYPLGFLLMRSRRLITLLLVALLAFQCYVWWRSPILPLNASGQWVHHGAKLTWWNLWYYTTVPATMLPFLAGMQARLLPVSAPFRGWVVVLCTLAISLLCFFPYGVSPFAAATAALALFCVLIVELGKNGQGKREALLGNFTYSLYLVHQFLAVAILSLLGAYWIAVGVEGKLFEPMRRRLDAAIPRYLGGLQGVRVQPAAAWIAVCVGIFSVGWLLWLYQMHGWAVSV